jgi:alanyl-tRNA synthetase
MSNLKPEYIIADHIRASCFIIANGTKPSGKQRGYVLRRLIRRSLSNLLKLKIDISKQAFFEEIVDSIISIYDNVYLEIKENRGIIIETLYKESTKYLKAIKIGEKEWDKIFKQAGL